jgi:hypothetical protein
MDMWRMVGEGIFVLSDVTVVRDTDKDANPEIV